MTNLKLIKLWLLALFGVITISVAANAYENSQQVNVCYESLSKAYVSLDAQKMVDVYVNGGHYISAGSREAIIEGSPALSKLYQSYFARLKKHNSSLDLHFRVSDRLTDQQSVTDVGYYVVTIIPPKGSGQPAKQHAGKFMMTFKVNKDGKWGIWAEANNKAKVQSYINAKPQGGLHFDDYFPISHYQEK